jgi:hypothetical protein
LDLQGAYGHELKNIALDGDHRLYVSIASTCNACLSDRQSDPMRGAIYVYNADGSGARLFARGLRNAEGLAVVPGTNVLWAAVNNRDNIRYPRHADITGDGGDDFGRILAAYVDDNPPDAFARVRDGGDYGWPFCNSTADSPSGLDEMPLERDVELNADGSRLDCDAADRTTKGIQAHSAPLGMTFLQGSGVPAPYDAGAAIALHGSWNRQWKTGYKVVFFPWDAVTGRPGAQVDLVTGWASDFDQWGRPVDVAVDRLGAILISDDYSGAIYRLTYAPPASAGASLVDNNSGKCLDVLGAGRAPGTPLVIFSCHDGDNQRFTLPAVGATGEVRAYGGTMCLDAFGGRSEDGDRIVVWPCHGGANQQWTRTANSEILGVNGKCIDVLGARTEDLTTVWLWTCLDTSNQRWNPGT